MNQLSYKRARWSALAIGTAALLGASALTAAPAFADVSINGQVLDVGAPVNGVDVNIYKYDALDRDWDYWDDTTTAADGTWAYTGALDDGQYSFYYNTSGTSAVYSSRQTPTGGLYSYHNAAQFTVTGGVASATSFPFTLQRNAGVLQVSLATEAGVPIAGDAADGYGYLYAGDRYDELKGYYGDSSSVTENLLDFDGTLSLAYLPAGTYFQVYAYGEDADGNGYGTNYYEATTVTAGVTTTLGQARLVSSVSPYVDYPYPHIDGVAKVGSLLTATTQPTAASLSYQWYSENGPIIGATAQTFVPTSKQLQSPIQVRVTGRQAGHKTDYWYTNDTDPVQVGDPDAATVAISGSAKFSGTLKATVSSPLAGTVAYQWYRNGAVVAGEDGSSYDVTKADLGKSVFVSIKSTAQGHTDAVIPSAAVAIAKETASVKASTDKTIKTKTTPKVKVTVKASKSGIGTTAKVRVYYTKTKYKSATVKSGKSVTIKLPKLKKGTTTLKVVYPGTSYYNAKTVSIKVKVSK